MFYYLYYLGQTGSGKTHSMGSQHMNETSEQKGIIPRVIDNIFEIVENNKDFFQYLIRVSYIEIYNETLKCLLSPKSTVSLREHESKGVIVVGAKEELVENSSDMYRCLETGALYRTTGSTLMNQQSSRSHSIFTIILEKRAKENVPLSMRDVFTSAKFHLIDLAGSERNKRTNTTGVRFKEAIQINCGLLALGNVISALGDEKKRRNTSHVPYRDSKLTRLLQNSLGGNSKTLMIACVSPADSNFEETLNTLKYAHRTRNIKNKPVVNRDPQAAELARMKMQIQSLQAQLRKQQNGEIDNDYVNALNEISTQELQQVKHENDLLSQQISEIKDELSEANDAISELTISRLKYQRRLHEIASVLKDIKSEIEIIEKNPNIIAESNYLISLKNALKKIQESIDLIESDDLEEENQNRIADLPINSKFSNRMNKLNSDKEDIDNVLQKQLDYIKQLEEELKEAKADLYRDEQIFSDKIKEIKKLKEQNHDYRKKIAYLKRENSKKGFENLISETSSDIENKKISVTEVNEIIKKDINNKSPPELEELERNINELKIEKDRLIAEKNRIEEEKDQIEEQTKKEKEEALANQEKVRSQMNNLAIMIRLKEELIRDLVKSDNESKYIHEQYENKIQSLEQEMRDNQIELEKALIEIEEKTIETQAKEKEKAEIKEDFRLKIQQMKNEMSKIKKKVSESRLLVRDKQKSDKRIKELEEEVSRMKAHEKQLKDKIKQDSEKLEEKTAERSKQITDLKKDAFESHKRIKELEQENQKKQQLLVRKSEKLQQFQEELLKYEQYEKENKANKEKRLWLDKEVEKYLKKKEMVEKLEKELKRREEIISKRESYHSKKEQMKKKKLKSNQAMKESISNLSNQIRDLEEQIKEKKAILASLDRQAQEHLIEVHTQLKDLKNRRAKALHQKKQLEVRHEEQQYRDEEKLREIDDMTEVLDAEIEYKNEEIEKAQQEIELEDDGSINEQFSQIKDLAEAQQFLSEYFAKVIDLKLEEKKLKEHESELQVNLKESERLIENLNNNIRLTEAVYERRLMKQAREYELKIQVLVKQLQQKQENPTQTSENDKDEQLSILQKDNFYYRKTNHALKNKLKEFQRQFESLSNEDKSKLELQEELRNLKNYVQNLHSMQTVRKNMGNLKELSQDQLTLQ